MHIYFFSLEIIFRETKHSRCYYFSRCSFLSQISSQHWRCPGWLCSLPGSSKPQPTSWARHWHQHQLYRFWEIFLGHRYLKIFMHMMSMFTKTSFLLQSCTDIYLWDFSATWSQQRSCNSQCQLPPSSTQLELQELHMLFCYHCGLSATANITGVPQHYSL